MASLVFVAGAVRGQLQVDLGVKGGMNLSNINALSSVVSSYGPQTGYHGGLYGQLKIDFFAFQTEVIYSTEGQQYKFFYPGYPSFTTNTSYINIPLMLKFYVAGGLNLQIGPQIGILNSAKGYTYLTSNYSGLPTVTEQSMGHYFKGTNMSLCIGAGLDLPAGFNLTFRYNGGLSNINNISSAGTQLPASPFGTSAAKTEVLQFSIGYRLLKIKG